MEEILNVERIEWEVLIRKEIQSGHSLYHIWLVGVLKESEVSKFRRNAASQTLWRESALITKRKRSRTVNNFAFIHPQLRREPRWGRMHACMLSRCSRVRLCATLWTAAHQAPPSTAFSRQEYRSGLPFPSPRGEWIHVYVWLSPFAVHLKLLIYY